MTNPFMNSSKSTKGQEIGILVDGILNIDKLVDDDEMPESEKKKHNRDKARYIQQIKRTLIDLGII